MSTFACPVVQVRAIEPIPGADNIEVAVVGDYRSVVRKGDFVAGSATVYIPESAVLPDDLLMKLGLEGKLAGANKNRVKAIKLRGVLSQGILYKLAANEFAFGEDFCAKLGIVKYEPPIPGHMAGEVANLFGVPLKYDIENFKAYPDVIQPGEMVTFTEKTHGTFCGIAVIPGLNHPEMVNTDGVVYSKGLGAKGLVFKDTPANVNNIYMRVAKRENLHEKLSDFFPFSEVHLLGEVYGNGVQDLTYGSTGINFAAFDLWVDGKFLDPQKFSLACQIMGVNQVPVLYKGPFSRDVLYDCTIGRTVIGNGAHIREGVVVRPLDDRNCPEIGRVILKSVSGDYLTRKNKNATEFA